jgi:hypothetical protein
VRTPLAPCHVPTEDRHGRSCSSWREARPRVAGLCGRGRATCAHGRHPREQLLPDGRHRGRDLQAGAALAGARRARRWRRSTDPWVRSAQNLARFEAFAGVGAGGPRWRRASGSCGVGARSVRWLGEGAAVRHAVGAFRHRANAQGVSAIKRARSDTWCVGCGCRASLPPGRGRWRARPLAARQVSPRHPQGCGIGFTWEDDVHSLLTRARYRRSTSATIHAHRIWASALSSSRGCRAR